MDLFIAFEAFCCILKNWKHLSRYILNLTARRFKKTDGKRTASRQKTNPYSGDESNFNSLRQSLTAEVMEQL